MISFLARGILHAHLTQGVSLSGEAMSKAGLGAGRNKCESALKELRTEGFIRLETMSQGNGKIFRSQTVTPEGMRFFMAPDIVAPTLGASIPQYELYSKNVSNNLLTTYIAEKESGKNFPEEKESYVGYEFFSEGTPDDSRLRAAEVRDNEWKQERDANNKKRLGGRWSKEQREWRGSDLAYEFEERLVSSMRFPRYSVNRKVFVSALTNAFRANDIGKSDGEIAVKAMELFLSRVNLKEFTTADHVCLTFVKNFPVLVETVRLSVASPVQEEEAEELLDKKMARVREALKNVQA